MIEGKCWFRVPDLPKCALALLLFFGLPAAAVDACSALNPIEIAATLRGHGTVIAFRSKEDQDHLHTCFFARVSQVGSFEENVKRIQSENPLILTFVVADGAGSNGLSEPKPEFGDCGHRSAGDWRACRSSARPEG